MHGRRQYQPAVRDRQDRCPWRLQPHARACSAGHAPRPRARVPERL